ncbi:MAG: hypothetical protein JO362_15135 [Streptomycetaceae bacterium]|nr:hypothetical protein [Streptomycetaceae bacterium]
MSSASDPASASAPASVPDDATPPVPRPNPPAALVFDDPFDRQSSEDTDETWGDRSSAQSSAADLARFLDEKPPHHI